MFGLFYGCFKYMFSKTEYSVAILGLDDSGKTTLTEQIKSLYSGLPPPNPDKITPTIGLNVRRVDVGFIKLRLWDLGGETGMRKIWPNYYSEADGVIFVVDATNREKLLEAKKVFEAVVDSGFLKKIPVLIFLNKYPSSSPPLSPSPSPPSSPSSSSLSSFISAEEITEYFRLSETSRLIRGVSVEKGEGMTGEGVRRGVDWLAGFMRKYVVAKDTTKSL